MRGYRVYHPISYMLSLKGLSRLILSHPDAISQEGFFSNQAEYLSGVEKSLLLKGYDRLMMEHLAVSKAVRNIISEGKARVSAIFPENERTCLDDVEGNGSLTVIRTPQKLTKGYIIFDDWGATEWDSKEPTFYGPEIRSSYFRVFQLCPEKYGKLMKDFAREQKRLSI